jgi:hypothetical protein
MKPVYCLFLMLVCAPSHAVLLQISQYGFDDVTGQQFSFSAYADTDAVIESDFQTFALDGELLIDPSWNIELTNIRMDTGSQIIESATGQWSFGADLASPVTYDAFYAFRFDGWRWSANEARLDGRITATEFATWEDPIAGLLQSHTLRSRDGHVFSPEGTRVSRFVFDQVSGLQISVVPEPGSFGLLAVGLAGIALRFRRPKVAVQKR